MTTIKSIGKAAFIALTIANLTCCASGSRNSDNNISSETGAVSISYRSDFVDINDGHTSVTINLKDMLERQDTFDAHELIGGNYIGGETLQIKFKCDAEVVKAEKVTHLYPTIWAGMDDKAIQFIYLFNLEYKDVQLLTVNDGIIDYPSSVEGLSETVKVYFDYLTKAQITSSIEKVPMEYEKKGTMLIYELDSWKAETKVWNRLAQHYSPGELTNDKNEPFEVNPLEIDLVVTFKGKNGEFTKTFHDEAIIGN